MMHVNGALVLRMGLRSFTLSLTASLVALIALQGGAATLLVTNTSASGPGSLRQAILDANATNGLDTIIFQIPGTELHTITPTSTLPTITDPVVIDGTTQFGFSGTPRIEISGAYAESSSDGFRLSAGNSTIRGLAITFFGGVAIDVQAPGGTNVIQGNFIGTDPDGTQSRGNGWSAQGGGMWIRSSGNLIGGPYATNRNLISGNNGAGLWLRNCSNNVVQGNLIGTSISGNTALPNTADGVVLFHATANLVGGTLNGARNLISGNGANGINLGEDSEQNLLQGNYVGTDVSGSVALGNSYDGVLVGTASASNTVGGTDAGVRNVISGNGHFGVDLFEAGTSNLVQGNFIGTDAAGKAALRNQGSGVCLSGSHSNLIGGTVIEARNIISANGLMGIAITNASGNVVAGNFVGTDVTGTNGLGNTLAGIQILSGTANRVGGTSPNTRNLISGNGASGLEFMGSASGNVVQGNYIGTDPTGRWALSNKVDGVHLESGGNTIGGAVGGAGNLISGNLNNGITLLGNYAEGNDIQGNLIGTDLTGTAAIPNWQGGVGISGAPSNTIGGTVPGTGNLISGNGSPNKQGGIYLINAGATGNLIQGNRIGTDLSGRLALGNRYEGVFATNTGPNTIGGAAAGAGNLISANGSRGIFLSPAWGTVIQGNLIGVDATGTNPLGNGTIVLAAAVEMEEGSHDNLVGGAKPAAGNRIAFAPFLRSGVRIRNGATNNAILANAIFSNAELGIDLGYGLEGGWGVTPNVPCNTSGGANMAQNYPVLTQAVSGNGTGIRGTLNSRPNRTYTLQFFANAVCNALGYGEGQTYLGQTTVMTIADCNASFLASLPVSVPPGSRITATATDGANNTSEFSACITVAPVPPLTVSLLPATRQLRLSWTNTPSGFVLKQTGNLSPPVQWTAVSDPPGLTNGQFVVTLPVSTNDCFYALSFE